MAKNRPLRPGEDKPTPARGSATGGGNRKPNKPKIRKPNKPKGGGGGTSAPPADPGLTATSPIAATAPPVPFSSSPYGYTGATPYLNTDEGILAADLDPEGYLTYLHGRKGFSAPGTVGGSQPFNNWLMQERYPSLISNYGAAHLVNPNLNFVQYGQTLGAPADAANHVAGVQQPMGTGTAVDTGNPYTSSSGTGIPPLPSPSAPAPATPAAPAATNPFNKNKRPNAFKRWNKNNKPVGTQAPGPNTTYNPPSGLGGTQNNLGLMAQKDREAFLGLSPELRGEKAVDNYSGRWSAWGD